MKYNIKEHSQKLMQKIQQKFRTSQKSDKITSKTKVNSENWINMVIPIDNDEDLKRIQQIEHLLSDLGVSFDTFYAMDIDPKDSKYIERGWQIDWSALGIEIENTSDLISYEKISLIDSALGDNETLKVDLYYSSSDNRYIIIDSMNKNGNWQVISIKIYLFEEKAREIFNEIKKSF